MKKVFAVLCILASACAFGQSYTAVTATNAQVDNGSGGAVNPPSGSNLCFLGVNNKGAAITYTPAGGSPVSGPVCQTLNGSGNLTGSLQVANPATASPIGLLYTITIVNGSTTYLTIPEVSISGALFQFSNFTLPVNGKALGIGFPHLSCTAGAMWTSTTLPPSQQAFTCNLVSGAGSWQTYPKGGSYCPAGMGYVTPQITGAPFCIPPVISGTGAPTGSCINGSTYYQQDNPGVAYGCVNGAWSPVAGGGVPGITSFQGRSTPGATIQSNDITSILQNGPFGLTGTQGMLFDEATGTAQPSSNWVLGTGGNAGKLYGYKDFNLAPNNTTSPVASISAATGAASFGNGTATISAAGVVAAAAGSTVNGSTICTTANGACPTSGAAYYQNAQNATTPLTQRSKLNFITSTGITGTDDSGNASTDLALSAIPNSALANNAITVNVTGSATGGGTIPLGGSTTINVTGGAGSVIASPQFYMFLQPSSGTAAVAQGAAIGQNGVAPMLQGKINSDLYATGGGNNGISNALSSTGCTTAGCFFNRTQTSTDTEVIQLALKGSYTHGQDNTYGTNQHFFYNAGLNSGVTFREANPASCFWNDSLVSQANNENCRSIYSVIANPARYGQGFALGSPLVGHADVTSLFKYTRSIDVAHGTIFDCLAIGDCIARYTYLYPRGGTVQGADEGTKGDALHIIEPGSPAGFVTIGGANATLVTTNFAGNGGNQGDGYDLLDTPDIMASGNLVSCSAGTGLLLNSCTTSDTHAVSTAYGVTTAACGTYTVRNAPVSSSCAINVTVGSFSAAANATVCIGDYKNPEQASITATGAGTITVGFAYTHPTGTPIYQGGLCGAKLTLGNGLTDPRVAPNYPMTTYFIAGSLSSTSLDYIVQFNAGQNGNFQLAIPSMPTYNISGTITRSSNVVTVTNFFPNVMFPYNNYVAPGAATIVVSGATPSDLNGVVTGVKVTPTTISWNQTGANETGSGGTLSVTGLNNYLGYCGAETVFDPGVKLGAGNNSTVPFQTGQLQLEPNNCNWTVGDEVIQPNFYSNTVIARDTVLSGFTPGLFGLAHIGNSIDMSGAMYSGAQFLSVHDAESSNLFQGYGGTLLPHQFLNASDVETNIFTFKYPPINNGYLFSMGCPPEGCISTSYNYNLFQLGSPTGASVLSYAPSSGYFYWSNPVIASMWTAAETGIGVSVLGQAPGTNQVGGFFTPIGKVGVTGTNNTLNFGNGAIADASGTLGMNNLVAPNVVVGINNSPNPVPLTFGSGGTTTYTYACVVRSANGTTAAASGTLTNGPATLSTSNYNFPRCPVVPAGQSIDVYRTVGGATQGKIGNIANGDTFTLTPFKDTGLTGDGTTPPSTNTTGNLAVLGTLATVNGKNICLADGTNCPAGSMVYPGAGVAVSTGSAWTTSIPTANISLLNGANVFTGGTSSFNNGLNLYASEDLIAANATSGSGNLSSPALTLIGNYWNGSGSVTDTWQLSDVLGTGTAPTSTLTFNYSGTGTNPTVSLPSLSISGSGPSQAALTYSSAPTVGSSTTAVYAVGSSGQAEVSEAAGAFARICTATNGVCGIANSTATVGTATINANTCTSASTVTMTGVTTSMVITFTPSTDISAVTGWGSSGGLRIVQWPTANTVNYRVCNDTASNITPTASVTFNVGAR